MQEDPRSAPSSQKHGASANPCTAICNSRQRCCLSDARARKHSGHSTRTFDRHRHHQHHITPRLQRSRVPATSLPRPPATGRLHSIATRPLPRLNLDLCRVRGSSSSSSDLMLPFTAPTPLSATLSRYLHSTLVRDIAKLADISERICSITGDSGVKWEEHGLAGRATKSLFI